MLKLRIFPPASKGSNPPDLTQRTFIMELCARRQCGFWLHGRGHVIYVDELLVRAKVRQECVRRHCVRAQHDDLGVRQYALQIPQQNSDVRNVCFDELSVRSDQLTQRDVFIPNLDVATLGYEFL